jgi:hypothetical protein
MSSLKKRIKMATGVFSNSISVKDFLEMYANDWSHDVTLEKYFRKIALKYHPDKLEGTDKDRYKGVFAAFNNFRDAYKHLLDQNLLDQYYMGLLSLKVSDLKNIKDLVAKIKLVSSFPQSTGANSSSSSSNNSSSTSEQKPTGAYAYRQRSSSSAARKHSSKPSSNSSSSTSEQKPTGAYAYRQSASSSAARKHSSKPSSNSSSSTSEQKPTGAYTYRQSASSSTGSNSFRFSWCSKLKGNLSIVQQKAKGIKCNTRTKSAALMALGLIALANTSYISDTSTYIFDTSLAYACDNYYIRPYMPDGWCGGVLDQIYKIGEVLSGLMDHII